MYTWFFSQIFWIKSKQVNKLKTSLICVIKRFRCMISFLRKAMGSTTYKTCLPFFLFSTKQHSKKETHFINFSIAICHKNACLQNLFFINSSLHCFFQACGLAQVVKGWGGFVGASRFKCQWDKKFHIKKKKKACACLWLWMTKSSRKELPFLYRQQWAAQQA